jgi:hypothetical protein
MIYLFCLIDSYNYYKNIIDPITENYNYINLIIVNNDEELYKFIINNKLLYSNKIFINNISEEYIKKILILNKNLYILNTRLLINDDLSYLINYNIKIIDYSILNKDILEKYKKVKYLPCQINNDLIINNEKIYDIAIIGVNTDYMKNIYEYIKNKNINITNLNDYDDKEKNDIISKHKILIYINNYFDNNIIYENICEHAIYNKVIIINDKTMLNYNDFLNNYIINVPYNLLTSVAISCLENYNENYNNIYKYFDLECVRTNIKNIGDNIFKKISTKNKIGFILIRNVNCELSNKFWIESYKSIRKYYDNKIIIVDDNSDYNYIKCDIEIINCDIIQSEFKARGEILGYYYYYKYNFFEKAVILHDSVFINKYINFDIKEDIKFIWHFTHVWDDDYKELELLNKIENNIYKKNLIDYYHQKSKWFGCFGLQSVIKFDFLEKIVNKYNIFNLVKYINNRPKRMNFERIFALICTIEDSSLEKSPSMFGIIHHYIHWGYTFEAYENDKKNNKLDHLEIIKTWFGR